MGKDFSYCIMRVLPGAKPGNPTYDDWIRMDDGRNRWDGPCGGDYYTKDQMHDSLESYVSGGYHTPNIRFTLKAFGQIISEMGDDDVVYIRYG